MIRFAIPRNVWLDLGASTALLVALNFLLARTDPGWVHTQISPYLLIPVLVGARYGLGAGIAGAGIAFAIAAIGQIFLAGAPWSEFFSQRYALLAWSLAFGGICGEIRFRTRSRLITAMVHKEECERKLKAAESELV